MFSGFPILPMGRVWSAWTSWGKFGTTVFFGFGKNSTFGPPPKAVRQVRPGSADLATVLPSPVLVARLVDAPGGVLGKSVLASTFD